MTTPKKPRKRSRGKHVPTQERRNVVQHLAANGMTVDQIANVLDVNRSTVLRHYRTELDCAKDKLLALVTGKLVEKIHRGETAAIIFWLKTQAGWQEKREATPPTDGDTVHIYLPHNGRD
jgi:transposase